MHRLKLHAWAQAAGLIATAWVVWATSIAPQWGRGRAWRIAADAGWVAVWALALGAVMALALHWLTRSEWRSGAAIWFAPAVILLAQFTWVGIAGGVAIVVNATRMLCAPGWQRPSRGESFWLALAASVALQLSALFYVADWRARSAAALAMTIAALTAIAIARDLWGSGGADLPRSVVGLCITMLLALMIGRGKGGAAWGLGWGLGVGAGDSGEIAETQPSAAELAKQKADRLDPLPEGEGDDYWGVILWPEIKPVTMLIAPPAPGGGIRAGSAHPLSIPFGGEYWLFRAPFDRPPPRSHRQRGKPTSSFFATTDRHPLEMEARHKLEQPLTATCCGSMLVEIRNADKHPGTVELEALLLDGVRAESLGIQPVRSAPDPNAERPEPVSETLVFDFPAAPRIERFDQIRLVFHRAPSRQDKSARVAIERFVLRPRT